MAEVTKKTKAPAKPKKAAATTTPQSAPKATKKNTIHALKNVPREQIELLARQYWAERGWQDGYAEQDWLRAEAELRQKAS